MSRRSDFDAQMAHYITAAREVPAVRRLPAAAVPRGAVVRLESAPFRTETVTVAAVTNSTPRAGRITWTTAGGPVEVGGSDLVEVVSLP